MTGLNQTVMTMTDLLPVLALVALAWVIRTSVKRVRPDER